MTGGIHQEFKFVVKGGLSKEQDTTRRFATGSREPGARGTRRQCLHATIVGMATMPIRHTRGLMTALSLWR